MIPKLLTIAVLSLLIPAHAQDAVIGRVGESEIKADQITPYLVGLTDTERTALTSNPALLNQTVRNLIVYQALYKEALAANWDKNPETIALLDRLRQSTVTESYLASISKIPENYPSDAEITATYEARKSELLVPKQLRLAQIFIAAPEADKAARDAARVRIDGIIKSLKAPGSDFADVARDQSEERETATRGGEVGWLAEASIRPEILSKISSLAKGATSEPISLADGLYVVKVLDSKDPHTATLDEVRERLIAALREDRTRQNREAYLSKVQQRTPIALDELSLIKLIEK